MALPQYQLVNTTLLEKVLLVHGVLKVGVFTSEGKNKKIKMIW
jgi:hypothetical protein